MPTGILLIIDPPQSLKLDHDSSLALIMACHQAGRAVAIVEPRGIFVQNNQVWAQVSWLKATTDYQNWYTVRSLETLPLTAFQLVFMRKDPPCDLAYIHLTHQLSLAKQAGACIVNDPDSLRLFHEKWLITRFPDCAPPTLVTADQAEIQRFIQLHETVVLKPLDGMGGRGVFVLKQGDLNTHSLLETMLQGSSGLIMVQRYLKEVREGDKRILVLHGEAFPFALARVPSSSDFRGNLAAGGRGYAQPLSDRDQDIVRRVSPFLKEQGLAWVGLDVIGDYLTEINITSPTCLRELDALCGSNIASLLLEGFHLQ